MQSWLNKKREKNRIILAGFRTVSSYPEENLHLSLDFGKSSSYTDQQCNKTCDVQES